MSWNASVESWKSNTCSAKVCAACVLCCVCMCVEVDVQSLALFVCISGVFRRNTVAIHMAATPTMLLDPTIYHEKHNL